MHPAWLPCNQDLEQHTKVIALSSGEAEYYGMVKGRALYMDFGINMGIQLGTDSSAAMGISKRSGLGHVRHIELNKLWLSDKVTNGDVEMMKVAVRPIMRILHGTAYDVIAMFALCRGS